MIVDSSIGNFDLHLLLFFYFFIFAQIKMELILTTTVKLPVQGVQETPPIKVYRNKVPQKKSTNTTDKKNSGHSYKVADVSINHDNIN